MSGFFVSLLRLGGPSGNGPLRLHPLEMDALTSSDASAAEF
jgi:hypothetical protein